MNAKVIFPFHYSHSQLVTIMEQKWSASASIESTLLLAVIILIVSFKPVSVCKDIQQSFSLCKFNSGLFKLKTLSYIYISYYWIHPILFKGSKQNFDEEDSRSNNNLKYFTVSQILDNKITSINKSKL